MVNPAGTDALKAAVPQDTAETPTGTDALPVGQTLHMDVESEQEVETPAIRPSISPCTRRQARRATSP